MRLGLYLEVPLLAQAHARADPHASRLLSLPGSSSRLFALLHHLHELGAPLVHRLEVSGAPTHTTSASSRDRDSFYMNLVLRPTAETRTWTVASFDTRSTGTLTPYPGSRYRRRAATSLNISSPAYKGEGGHTSDYGSPLRKRVVRAYPESTRSSTHP